ncbi:MAG: hypothetical protein LUO80_02255 [Methylococcaceae bacterium]|nr:hypothetical protein [Methylococcaceae bacterium]
MKVLLGWLAWTSGWNRALAAGPPNRVQPPSARRPAAGDIDQALALVLGGRAWLPNDAVRMEIPQLAENGAIVPITVESRLPDTRRILVFAEKNPDPLLAEFHFEPGADPWVTLRLKLNETGPVLAIVESGGQFHGAKTIVKVMLGGCG